MLLLSIFIFAVSAISDFGSYKDGYRWCDVTKDGTGKLEWIFMNSTVGKESVYDKTNEERLPCEYYNEYSNSYHGFVVDYSKKDVDVFNLYFDCCSPHENEKALHLNKFTVTDIKDGVPKEMNFIFTAEEWKRAYHLITIENNAKNAPWTINTDNMVSKSSIILSGERSYEEAQKNPYKIISTTSYINITSHKAGPNELESKREVVYLSFSWGSSPFLNISGNIDIYLQDEVDRDNCQYRFSIAEEEGYEVRLMGVDNENLEMKVICQHGIYKRVAVCSKYFLSTHENFEDCTCSYADYEYVNMAFDCSHVGETLNFKPSAYQDTVPNENRWKGFECDSASEIILQGDTPIIITEDVTLPENSLVISGNMEFEKNVIISKTDVLYDLGNFKINGTFKRENIDDKNVVFFVGKCEDGDNFLDCQNVIETSNLKAQKCGGAKLRYISKDSELGCKCTQTNGKFVQSDCDLFSQQQALRFDATLTGDFNGGKDTKRYWNTLTYAGEIPDEVSYISKETLVMETCDFSAVKTMKLQGKLRCEKIIVSGNTKIIGEEGSILQTYSIEIKGVVSRNINEEAIFSFGKGQFISDSSMEFIMTLNNDEQQDHCFELATSSEEMISVEEGSELSGEKFILYDYSKLMRICPKKENLVIGDIECHQKDPNFDKFDKEQCPCSGSNCVFYSTDKEDYDIILSKDLNGKLVIKKDIVLYSSKYSEETKKYEPVSISTLVLEENVVAELNGDFIIGLNNKKDNYNLVTKGDITFSGYADETIVKLNSRKEEAKFSFEEGAEITVILDAFDDTEIKINEGYVYSLKRGLTIDSQQKIVKVSSSEACSVVYFDQYEPKCLYNIVKQTETTVKCIENCVLCSDEQKCDLCADGFTLTDDKTKCNENSDNCLRKIANQCLVCKEGYMNDNGVCKTIPTEGSSDDFVVATIVGNTPVSCVSGYQLTGGKCEKCPDNCASCYGTTCYTCNEKYVLQNGNCVDLESSNCLERVNGTGICGRCKSGFRNRANCVECPTGCGSCTEDGRCLKCKNANQYFNTDGGCSDLQDDNKKLDTMTGIPLEGEFVLTDSIRERTYYWCQNYTSGQCLRCSNGYYAINGYCEKCPTLCKTCFLQTIDANPEKNIDGTDRIHCTSCAKSDYVVSSDYKCVPKEADDGNCATPMSAELGCAVCKNGYYRDSTNKGCAVCPEPFETCTSATSPLSCKETHYLYTRTENNVVVKSCELKTSLENCKNPGSQGCNECYEGFFVSASKCKACVERCVDCVSENECRRCSSEFIVKNNKCEHYKIVANCISSDGVKCNACSSGYTLKGGECDKDSIWYVYLIVALVVLVIIVVIVIIIAYVIMKRNMKLKQDDIQKIKHLNVDLNCSHDFIVSDHDKFTFYEDNVLKVNETRKFEQIIGNVGKHRIKIQPTLKNSEKYEFTVEPALVILGNGKCTTFKFEITPLCTTHIEETIVYNILMFKLDQESTFEVQVDADTNVTNILDYDELQPEKKVGEGSFGIVYKGKFRGNKVAIKTLKAESAMDEQLEEFNKEVSMLDKFRSPYIVHFYGAVFIPNRICMVTEFAKFGSLAHLIEKEQGKKVPKEAVRIKICMDGIRGMMYLHQNGILHRDIKPDNLLIFSLEKDIPVFAKLTDFGSSRNINLMMTNMTFTKGIGTPAYMAPEVLDQSRYKTAADVFSMAITLFETMKWGTAYPKTEFKYPWDIASYVSAGKRPVKPKKMRQQIYDILCRSWCHDPAERLRIEDLCEQFGKFNVNYQ